PPCAPGASPTAPCHRALRKPPSAAAPCCLAASAAPPPAGPPPTTTILRPAFMRRLRSARAGPRIIDTSATLRLDASEQRSMERNGAVGPTLGAYSDGEKESSRQDRRARTTRTAVLGRDRDSTA